MVGQPAIQLDLAQLHCSRPTIMVGPKSIRVPAGESALFKCRAAGNPKPHVMWFKNATHLSSNEEFDGIKYEMTDDGGWDSWGFQLHLNVTIANANDS